MWLWLVRAGRWIKTRAYEILTENAASEMIALGAAVGVFVAVLPCPFAQVILALLLATALHANRAAALLLVWVANPVFFYIDYAVGRLLLAMVRPATLGAAVLSWSDLREQIQQGGFLVVKGIFLPMLIGSIVFGLFCAATTYLIALSAVRHCRGRLRRADG
ncbi:MAG: DUF2062 domain-containing protein [Planctomycetota bacterium]|jgi:uncharacterized protein (DUF2062 family)